MAISAVGLFHEPQSALAAAGKLKDAGFSRPELMSPIPIHGVEDVLGPKKSVIRRFTLFGAIFGAIFIKAAESYVGDEFQATWFIILGAVFIVVVRFAPKGLAGVFELVISFVPYWTKGSSRSRVDVPTPGE